MDGKEMFNNLESALLDLTERSVQISKIIQAGIDSITESPEWQQFTEFISNIPEDVKESVFYTKVHALNKIDLKYEDIIWFIEGMDYNNLEMAESFIKSKSQLSALITYVAEIIEKQDIPKREKVVILLAHFEPLLYQAINASKNKYDKIHKIINEAAIKQNSGMTAESIGKVIILGIKNIIFSCTDRFKDKIDNRIPFRNNILHNGIVEVTNSESELAYEILVIFAAELVMIEEWTGSKIS